MSHPPQAITRLGDIDPAKFTLYACCGACDHSAPVDPEKADQAVEVQTLPFRLRCAECGSRDCSIRIV